MLTPISIHALLAESDQQPKRPKIQLRQISIHALLAESDVNQRVTGGSNIIFLSTLSLRRATGSWQYALPHQHISIHALLAESDR